MADNVVPTADGAQDLGTAAKAWGKVFTKTLNLNGSDVAVVTSVGTPGLDTSIPTEKAVRTAIAAIPAGVTSFKGRVGAVMPASGDYSASDVGADATGTASAAVAAHVGAADPHMQYQLESEKGNANGYASLDATGKVPSTQIPAIAITEFLGVVASQAAMLALTGEKGDWCARSDEQKNYIIIANDGHLITDWQAMYTPSSPVLSVNGQTGVVTLSYSDVGAAAAAHASQHGIAGLDSVFPFGSALQALRRNATNDGLEFADVVTDLSGAVILAPTVSTRNVIQPTVASAVPLVARGHVTQAVPVQEWQLSDGTVRASVDVAGYGTIKIGPQATTSTTSPAVLNLGGTFSSAAGANPKLQLYNDGAAVYGLGVSASQLDSMVPAASAHTWNVAGAEKMRLTGGGTLAIATATVGAASKLTVSAGTTVDASAVAQINTGADANKGLVVQRYSASQSANLTEWQLSTGAAIARVNPNCEFDWVRGTGGSSFCAGASAGRNVTTAGGLTAVGQEACAAVTTGGDNTAFGYRAVSQVTSGWYNVGVGNYAGRASTLSHNNFFGYSSGRYATGSGELYIDSFDRSDNATEKAEAIVYGEMSATVGSQKLRLNAATGILTGTFGTVAKLTVNPNNTVDNSACVQVNATAATNKPLVVQGCAAQSADLTQWQDSSGTAYARINANGEFTFARGAGAGNIAAGDGAGRSLNIGSNNSMFGQDAGRAIAGGAGNVAIGYRAAYNLSSGNNNTAVGYSAGLAHTTGAQSVYLGYRAGSRNTASYKLFIDGIDRLSTAAELTDSLIYGEMDATPANQRLRVNGTIGIFTGTHGTAAKMTVNPNLTTDNSACVQINATADGNKPLVIQRFSATQSANLTEWQSSTGVAQAWVSGAGVFGSLANPKKDRCGMENQTDSAMSMSGSNFQIAPAVSSFSFWVANQKFSKTVAQTVAIANDNTLHFVYFDSAGVLQVSTSAWDITADVVPVALVYKFGATYAIWDERHNYDRDRRMHNYHHNTVGVMYSSGLSATFGDATISVTQGIIYDEDLPTNTGGTKTTCRRWWRNTGGATMAFDSASSVPYKATGSQIQWDDNGTLTTVANNRYVVSWVYATPDIDYPIAVVSGQSDHASVASAQAEAFPAIPNIGTREWKLIYRAIYKQTPGGVVFDSAQDYRNVQLGPGSAVAPTDHNLLVNRDAAGSHPVSAITGAAALATANAFTSVNTITEASLTSSSGSVTWDGTTKQNALFTLTENVTAWTLNNLVQGEFLSLRVQQHASAAKTISWDSSKFKGMSGYTMNTTLGAADMLFFRAVSTSVLELVGFRQNVGA